VLPFDDRRRSRDGRARRRPGPATLERLEGRELLAYTPLGFSLPDLTITGFAAPVAAYGGDVTVTLDVSNLGASSIIEPLNMTPRAPSRADAGPTEVAVFLSSSTRPNRRIRIDTIDVPTVLQNSTVRITDSVTLPARPPRFPDSGGTVLLTFEINPSRQVQELDYTNNRTRAGVPVQIAPALPDLEAVALSVPPVLQAGDAIKPDFRIANFGTVDSSQQGPVTVFLVASQDTSFGPGDAILATYTIDNIAPLSAAPTKRTVLGDVNLDPPPNVSTILSPVVSLPTMPIPYFLGLAVDPNNTILELSELGRGPSAALSQVQIVGLPPSGLPPAGTVVDPTPVPPNLFPIPPFGPIFNTTTPDTGTDPGDDTGTDPGDGTGTDDDFLFLADTASQRRGRAAFARNRLDDSVSRALKRPVG
jgi:hypothetical protein